MNRLTYILPVFVLVIAGLLSSIYIVDEREQVLVLRFGQIEQTRDEAGWYFKLPLFDEVVRYEDRILSLETPLIEVTPADDRRLVVDAFVLWRIEDMVQFRQAVARGGQRKAEIDLGDILDGQIRAVLGSDGVTSNTILSPERTQLMEQIEERVNARASALGIDVVDVRLRQTNLPEQNFDATLQRMIAEREREAIDERARGQEAAKRVRAAADRTYTELLSEANRDSRIIEGQADAQRNRIFAEAYGQDPEFFDFYRSLTAYEQALQGKNSTMVLSPNSEFFNYMINDGVGALADVAPIASAADNSAAIRAAEEAAKKTTEEAQQASEALKASEKATGETPVEDASPAEEAPAEEAPAPEASDMGETTGSGN
ncbi:protease modulator HflC [Vannielia sp.]|uniref:protease modulator HflC n=1 Tax=Vannielia sp. TaxID=2813045 RepID=UPI002632CDF9|nr:protease modulator HflC [Vannielia sp.]MDF1871680.1 protease modulator HflC [Vannielia sp.]